MKKKIISIIMLTVLVLTLCACGNSSGGKGKAPEIAGAYTSLTYGNGYIFAKDGTCAEVVHQPGYHVSGYDVSGYDCKYLLGKYTTEENKVTVTNFYSNTVIQYEYILDGDDLTLLVDGKGVALTRTGDAPKTITNFDTKSTYIEGTYKGMLSFSTYTFTRDGRLIEMFDTYDKPITYHYTIKDGILTVDDEDTIEFNTNNKFEIAGDKLIIYHFSYQGDNIVDGTLLEKIPSVEVPDVEEPEDEDEDEGGPTGVVDTKLRILVKGGINIRNTPSTSGKVVGLAKQGAVYDILDRDPYIDDDYEWFQIGENEWIADDGTWVETFH